MAAKSRKTNRSEMVTFDSHAHVTSGAFDHDRSLVVQRAQGSGILFMEVGVDERSSSRSVELADEIEGYCAVGIHPHYASQKEKIEDRWALIENLAAASSRVKAVGEIGLDYFRNHSPKELQIDSFIAGLDVARRLGLPAIIHQRESSEDVISVAQRHSHGIPLVFHCFSGGREYARRCLDLGGYLGFGGPLTYPRNNHIRDMLKFLPLDRLLVETDCPYLPPQKMRGKRNEPLYVLAVVDVIARILTKASSEINRITFDNALRVFAIEAEQPGNRLTQPTVVVNNGD